MNALVDVVGFLLPFVVVVFLAVLVHYLAPARRRRLPR